MNNEIRFIKKSYPKDKVYDMWLAQLDVIEQSTIYSKSEDEDRAFENSMDIGFKLFPLIDSISLNLLGKLNGRNYLEKLGYSSMESDMIYSMFRNGMLHGRNPYKLKFDDGEIYWGIMSSSGSSGFVPHFPGYLDKDNPEYNHPADSAFTYDKLDEGKFHATLSLDALVAHVRYDLLERKKNDKSKTIQLVVGQEKDGKVPKIK